MNVHVVALQEGSNYYFDVECERVPQVGELFVERSAAYTVMSVFTFRKNSKAVPVITVKRGELPDGMDRMSEELEYKIR